MGPGYKIMSKVSWLLGKLAIIKSQNFKHAISSKIGIDKARKLAFAPHINIGVFSLDKNWNCCSIWIASNLLPKYDNHNNTFVEPYLPNNKIGIMHLAAGIWRDNKDMRIDKSITIEIKTLDNNIINKSLRFGL